MARQRRGSNVSASSSMPEQEQELGSMYDYLAKVILLGPSGSGKSCLLHRFVKSEWRNLTSQTIGVEFASKIVRVGTGLRRQRIKLQLWDTAGTERFRAVSRSYYRGAAGAIIVYDVSSHASFDALPTFLHDARTLASPQLAVLLAGNKADVASPEGRDGYDYDYGYSDSLPDHDEPNGIDIRRPKAPDASHSSARHASATSTTTSSSFGLSARLSATTAPHGREVLQSTATRWASSASIPVAVEVSAYTGEGVDELFARLARIILTKIELGEIDPDDPASGIQYGDGSAAWDGDGGSVRSGATAVDDGGLGRRGRRKGKARTGTWGGVREWEEVFRLGGGGARSRRRAGCC